MIYSFFNTLVKGYLKYRKVRLQRMYDDPHGLQAEVLQSLTDKLKRTSYGEKYCKNGIRSAAEYNELMPLVAYEDLYPYIARMMQGEEDLLWPGRVSWFAKSSGTTNDKSKFIPITDENFFDNHVAASWDAMCILYGNRPDARIFEGKNLIMGGSLAEKGGVTTGDVSAILLNRMPLVGRPFYTPDFEVALMADWEKKIEKMAEQCLYEDIVMLAGVPTWTSVLFKRILEVTGHENIREVWPNLRTYFHGGVGFGPYEAQFSKYLPGSDMEYYEVYNASEGYFAVQDRLHQKGMLLLLDNAIYYEFIPCNRMEDADPPVLTLREVEAGRDYCLVISTTSGLWRYKPGDVVKFVSTDPYRVMVSGRTKQYINVFGEEVMVHNTDSAISKACTATGAVVRDYTVAPVFMSDTSRGGHEWLIEFEKPPADLEDFANRLDDLLRAENSDYDAKRYKDLALTRLLVRQAGTGTFDRWLRSLGKLGGQSKVPRLCNDRRKMDEIGQFINP